MNRVSSAFLLLFIFAISSCKKESDFRNKYIGFYLFDYRYQNGPPPIEEDPNTHGSGTEYKGNITYNTDTKDEIIINYAPGHTSTFQIHEDGSLYSCGKLMGTFSCTNAVTLTYDSNECFSNQANEDYQFIEFTGRR